MTFFGKEITRFNTFLLSLNDFVCIYEIFVVLNDGNQFIRWK